jgi:hypothetical protein
VVAALGPLNFETLAQRRLDLVAETGAVHPALGALENPTLIVLGDAGADDVLMGEAASDGRVERVSLDGRNSWSRRSGPRKPMIASWATR